MSKQIKYHKTEMMRNKNKNYHGYMVEEEEISLKEIKRNKEHKHYRNYENALRSKDVNRLMSYEED
jgi:hypothetical protein